MLGLLLFSRFVNNHLPSSEESPVLFADSTTLSVAGHPIDGIPSMLTCVLDAAHIWLLDSAQREQYQVYADFFQPAKVIISA